MSTLQTSNYMKLHETTSSICFIVSFALCGEDTLPVLNVSKFDMMPRIQRLN